MLEHAQNKLRPKQVSTGVYVCGREKNILNEMLKHYRCTYTYTPFLAVVQFSVMLLKGKAHCRNRSGAIERQYTIFNQNIRASCRGRLSVNMTLVIQKLCSVLN